MLKEAVAASASAPVAFQPEHHVNKFGITEQFIDGGIICNTPAFYAFEAAKYLDNTNDKCE